ncbi:MAG: sensor histidine kinase [Candidatus Competibacterales bacterium]
MAHGGGSVTFPDFCGGQALLWLILGGELLALLLTLAGVRSGGEFWFMFAFTSLFIQWVILASAAALCLVGRHLNRAGPALGATIIFVVIQLMTLVTSLAMVAIRQQLGLPPTPQPVVSSLGHLAISAIVSFVLVRYLSLQLRWRQAIEANASYRFQALQARIRPHFLFNALNTIVHLVGRNSRQAEEAVLDLADLLRVALAEERWNSLGRELEVTRRYLHIEKLRLGERLQVRWSLDPALDQGQLIPALCLQPLVENAVYHGVQTLPAGGEVAIEIRRTARRLHITVDNPTGPPAAAAPQQHHGMAQDNIRQRLALAYGDSAHLALTAEAHHYRAAIVIPLDRRPTASLRG